MENYKIKIHGVFMMAIDAPWRTVGLDVQYAIRDVPGFGLVIAFQGSASYQDWRTNFDFPIVPYRDQPVRWLAYRGFVRAWKSARDEIMPQLANAKIVLVIGYSLGGAMAQLCMEDITFNNPTAYVKGIVFGSPRVFWMPPVDLKSRMGNLQRFENIGDIVPHVPPTWAGYQHIGFKNIIGSWKMFIKSLLPIKEWTDLPGAKMHLVGAYNQTVSEFDNE